MSIQVSNDNDDASNMSLKHLCRYIYIGPLFYNIAQTDLQFCQV